MQDPLPAAEALLGLAQIQRARNELEEALEAFEIARRRFRWLEYPGGERTASLGIAQVHLEEAP